MENKYACVLYHRDDIRLLVFLEEIPLFTKSLDMEIFFDSLPYTYAFELF